jgi:tetratricopeptide (TPR) repeat protein
MNLPRPRLRSTLLFALVAGLLGAGGWWLWQRSPWAAERRLAFVANDLKRWHLAEAAAELARCRARWSDVPAVYLLSARAERLQDNLDAAADFLREFLKRGGASEDHRREAAMLSAYRGHIGAADGYLQNCVAEEHPDDFFAFDALVIGNGKTYRLGQAEHWLKRWRQRYPDAIPALLHEGWLDERALHRAEAVACYERILALDPDNDAARLRLAQVLVIRKQSNQALEHLLVLQQHLPDNRHVLQELARCWLGQGEAAKATGIVSALADRFPDDAEIVALRGQLAMDQQQWEAAEKLLRRAHELQPFEISHVSQLQQCLAIQGKADEAKKCLAEVTQLKADFERIQSIVLDELPLAPRDPKLRCRAGDLLRRHGAYPEAIRWYESALREKEGYAPAHAALADCYEKTGRAELAQEHRRKAEGKLTIDN